MANHSKLFWACIDEVKGMGDDLFSSDCADDFFIWDCWEILQKHYGRRLDHMKAETIEKKIAIMYGNAVDVSQEDREEITEFVKERLSPYKVEVLGTGREDQYKFKVFINDRFVSWVEVQETYFYKLKVYNFPWLTFLNEKDIVDYFSKVRIKYDEDNELSIVSLDLVA